MTEIAVLGCGWLGLPLAEFLIGKGVAVKGSTTSPEKLDRLAEKGISPRLICLQPEIAAEHLAGFRSFLRTDVLVVDIPPRLGTQGHDFHVRQIRFLLQHLPHPAPQVIYVSSTSVYPDDYQAVTETSPVTEGNALVEAERLISKALPAATVLRCGGLMGYDRIPGKYVAGKTIDTGDVPVNFIHRDDVVRIIHEIIRQQKWGELYNVVAPQHPVRRDVYAQNVQDFGFAPPIYKDSPVPPHKVVNGEKLIRELNYSFLFPNPVMFHFEP